MQLMSDGIAVLGSRHGVAFDPFNRQSYLIRTEQHPGIPCQIRAGVVINGREALFPLCKEGSTFFMLEQDMTPTTMQLTGIDPASGLKVELQFITPFKPRDDQFSTTPIIDVRMNLSFLDGNFRWERRTVTQFVEPCELFFELQYPGMRNVRVEDDSLIRMDSRTRRLYSRRPYAQEMEEVGQEEAWVVHEGAVARNGGIRVSAPFDDEGKAQLHFSWVLYSQPAMSVGERLIPYRYQMNLQSLDEVIEFIRNDPQALVNNSRIVDGIINDNNCSRAVNNLMCQTLHTYLTDTWFAVDTVEEQEYFGVWEGSCYFQSTVDVEYTQTPFYLSLWPELLQKELDTWPLFAVSGAEVLEDASLDNTLVIAHDYGSMSVVRPMDYAHHMPVEENTNYVLMLYSYWRRTGDLECVERNGRTVRQVLDLIAACDTTGNGVPDRGMANTIDDASPAVQYGREQVYLAVKAMAAFQVGAEMLTVINPDAQVSQYLDQAEKIRLAVEDKGWKDDHFVTVLDATAHGVKDAWSDRVLEGDELSGWDASHIYTANGLALLDMVGYDTGLDVEKLRQDLKVATVRCMEKYGCRHSDYVPSFEELSIGEGSVKNSPRIGWISMNMLRDISAFYRGVDLRDLSERYWEYQQVTNSRDISFFFETVHGNNLKYYPRGVAVWGFFDALAGLQVDKVSGDVSVHPLNADIRVPLLYSADWESGSYMMLEDGQIVHKQV